jgi:hypothetical protein
MHSLHVPFLHELGKTMFADRADSSSVLESPASNSKPPGSTTTEKRPAETVMLYLP